MKRSWSGERLLNNDTSIHSHSRGGEERSASLLVVVRISYSRNERWDGEIRLLREVRGLLLLIRLIN